MNFTSKITLLFIVLLTFACTSDQGTTDQDIDDQDTFEFDEGDTSAIDLAVEPPRDAEELQIVDDQVKSSPFYNLGCCEQEDQRKRTCCCKAVVEKYEEIRKQDDTDLILKVKTEDPIFSACKTRKKWRLLIENIDNPPSEKGEEDDEEFDF